MHIIMDTKITPIQFNCLQMCRSPLWKVCLYLTWYLYPVSSDDACADVRHSNSSPLWRHRRDLCWMWWCHNAQWRSRRWRHNGLVRASNVRTLIITTNGAQITCKVWANFSQRRPTILQAVKLDRYNFCIWDDLHFGGIWWLFVELLAN